jgi:NAD+ kinase
VNTVGFLFHSRVDPQDPAIRAARHWLEQRGFQVWEERRSQQPDSFRRRLADSKLVVTFGGDGTLLWAAREAAPLGVPLLGINLGHLGFLLEVNLDQLGSALERWAQGAHRLEARALLQASVHPTEAAPRFVALALNDVLIHRGQISMARFEVAVDHEPVGTFEADGMLVSSATGSTGYALSMGGPIAHPRVRDLLFTPVNPHSLFNRALVLPPDSAIDIALVGEPGILICDGQTAIHVQTGERAHVQAAPYDVQLVRLSAEAPGFFGVLRRKIRWGTPLSEDGR